MGRKRFPLPRLVVASLVSPPVAAVIAGFALIGDAILLQPIMFGALLVRYPAMVLLGLPAHMILVHLNWRNGVAYGGAGAILGLLVGFVLSALIDPELGGAFEETAVAGAVCALLFCSSADQIAINPPSALRTKHRRRSPQAATPHR